MLDRLRVEVMGSWLDCRRGRMMLGSPVRKASRSLKLRRDSSIGIAIERE